MRFLKHHERRMLSYALGGSSFAQITTPTGGAKRCDRLCLRALMFASDSLRICGLLQTQLLASIPIVSLASTLAKCVLSCKDTMGFFLSCPAVSESSFLSCVKLIVAIFGFLRLAGYQRCHLSPFYPFPQNSRGGPERVRDLHIFGFVWSTSSIWLQMQVLSILLVKISEQCIDEAQLNIAQ